MRIYCTYIENVIPPEVPSTAANVPAASNFVIQKTLVLLDHESQNEAAFQVLKK